MLQRQAEVDRNYANLLEQMSAECTPPRQTEGEVQTRKERVDSGEDCDFMGQGGEDVGEEGRCDEGSAGESALLRSADCMLASVCESNALSAGLWRDFSRMIGESMIQGIVSVCVLGPII